MAPSALMAKEFLRRLSLRWLIFSLKGRRDIDRDELLRRFLTVRGWIKNNRLAPAALIPRAKEAGLSVHRASCKSDARLWQIGKIIAMGTRDRTLYGQAEIGAHKFLGVSLTIERDSWPTSHAQVVGWQRPAVGDPKSAWMLLAEKLLQEPHPPRMMLPPK